jgi:hypothetical protein
MLRLYGYSGVKADNFRTKLYCNIIGVDSFGTTGLRSRSGVNGRFSSLDCCVHAKRGHERETLFAMPSGTGTGASQVHADQEGIGAGQVLLSQMFRRCQAWQNQGAISRVFKSRKQEGVVSTFSQQAASHENQAERSEVFRSQSCPDPANWWFNAAGFRVLKILTKGFVASWFSKLIRRHLDNG